MRELSNNRLASFSDDRTIRIWNTETRIQMNLLDLREYYVSKDFDILFDDWLVFYCEKITDEYSGALTVWNSNTKDMTLSFKIDFELIERDSFPRVLLVLSNYEVAIGFSRGDVLIASPFSQLSLHRLQSHTKEIVALLELPQGLLVTGSYGTDDVTLKIWNIESRSLITGLSIGPVFALAYSIKSDLLFCACNKNAIKAFNCFGFKANSTRYFGGRYKVINAIGQDAHFRTFNAKDVQNKNK